MIFRWLTRLSPLSECAATPYCCSKTLLKTKAWEHEKFKHCSSLTDVHSREQALISERSVFLSGALKCNEQQAKDILNRNVYLLVKRKKTIEEKARFARECFSLEDITEHSQVLTLPLGPIKLHYYTLKEFGFKNITCSTLLNYETVTKQTPTQLIQDGHLELTCDPLQHVLTYLDSPQFTKLMTDELPSERYMESPIIRLKRVLLPRYLGHLFNVSIDHARLIIRLHHQLSGACFEDVNHCLRILQDIFNFPIEKIKLNPYLLHQDPGNLYKIAALPSLMGGNPLDIAHKFPKVISQPVENLLKIESMLRGKGVSDDVLRKSRYLFILSPETVRDIIIKRKLKKMLER